MELPDFGIYTYFWGAFIGLVATLYVYFRNPPLRKTLLVNGIAVALIGVILEYYFYKDYWLPPLLLRFGKFGGLEDLIFGFVVGGLGTTLPTIILHQQEETQSSNLKLLSRYYFVTLLTQLAIMVLANHLGINSIYASSFGFLLCSIIIIIKRPELIQKSLLGGLMGGVILTTIEALLLHTVGIQYLQKYFLLYSSVRTIGGLFVSTELLWGICFGTFIAIINDAASERKQNQIAN